MAEGIYVRIVSDDNPPVRKEWIHEYEVFPGFESYTNYSYSLIGVDLAIKEGSNNDYTAMVTASSMILKTGYQIYIHPNP